MSCPSLHPPFPGPVRGLLPPQGLPDCSVALLPTPGSQGLLRTGFHQGGPWFASVSLEEAWRWRPLRTGLPPQTRLWSLVGLPGSSEILWAALTPQEGSFCQLFASNDGGFSWEPRGRLGWTARVETMAVLDAQTLVVGGDDGLYRSEDGGETVQPVRLPEDHWGYLWSVAAFSPSCLAAVETRYDVLRGCCDLRFWHSQDGGASWAPAQAEASVLDLAPFGWGRVSLVAAGPNLGLGLLGLPKQGLAKGLLLTRDRGRHWSFRPCREGPRGLWTHPLEGKGLPGLAKYQFLLTDPDHPERLVAGSALALYASRDGGESWARISGHPVGFRRIPLPGYRAGAWGRIEGEPVLWVGGEGGVGFLPDPFSA